MRVLAVAAVALAFVACADGALPPRTSADPASPDAPESPFTAPSSHAAAVSAEVAPPASATAMPDTPGMNMP